ncbi:YadA-like family protein [Pelistega europaea]|uniref:Uncharacterized protein n=1 Tax=Pelistega europaea TaxID=106147 RepID=A0A7Y4LB75_9BURK|nr:YadA-like family protein [Pelistega europaea]NOL49222.1 hypothetical protein [Pelistega europaea]
MMKKTTLALAFAAIFTPPTFAQDAQPNIVNITINNVGDDSGLEMGTGSRARGQGSIATGKNSVALGKNAVATGGNEDKDSITQKLAENKQKLEEIATAEANTNRLLDELQNIRKIEADVIEAGERVKQVLLAKQSAYNVWQDKLKTYNDTVAGSAQFFKDTQAKIDDLNSRLTGVSRIGNVDIRSDEGLTNAATQLKSIAEQGTTLNLSVDFYKDYVSSYYKALGDLREAKEKQQLYNPTGNFGFGVSGIQQKLFSSTSSIEYDRFWEDFVGTAEHPYLNLKNISLDWVGVQGTAISNQGIISINSSPSSIRKITEQDSVLFLPRIDVQRDAISESTYQKVQAYWQQIWDAVPNAIGTVKNSLMTETDIKNLENEAYQNLLRYKRDLDTVYYQGKYEETRETTWLDRKASVGNEMNEVLKNYPVTYGHLAMFSDFSKLLKEKYNAWEKENITDVEEKNRITTATLTSELEKALGINKNAIAEKEAEIARLKTAADQAKSTYDNTNPSAADLALSQRYEEIMRQLTAKANELKSEQDRLQALRDALTLHDLTNVGENAYAIGTNALATGTNSLAIGTDTIVTGENSIAMGKGSVVTGTNSIAIGTGHNVLGHNSGAFGDPDYIYGNGSYAFGNNNTIGEATNPHNSGNNTFVLGSNVVTKANNAVILGADSADGGDNTVSVGSETKQRKIVYVADGGISSNSKDAINGSQLHDLLENATNINVTNWKAKLGVSSTGTTGGSTTGDSTTALNDKANTTLNNITTEGETVIKNLAKGAVKVVNGTNTTVTEGSDGDAKTYAVNVSNEAIKGAVQQDLDSKANKDASNLVSSDVQKWQEKLGNGINAQGDKGLITGDTLYTAIHSIQANVTVDNLASDVAQHLGGGATAVDGRVTAPTYSITDVQTGQTAVYNSVGGALQALDNNTRAITAQIDKMGGDIQSLRSDVQTLRKDAFAGTASAMAIAGLGQSTQPGKTSVSMSGSTYRGQNAYAFGVSRMSANGKFLLKGAVSGNNRGHYGGVVSATYTFD